MIFMRMGKDNCIYFFYAQSQHLVPEVRCSIHNNSGVFVCTIILSAKAAYLLNWKKYKPHNHSQS